MRAYGWTADGELIAAEADVLRRAAASVLAGVGTRQICRELAADGVVTVAGTDWSPTTLKRALASPRMIGRKADSMGRPIMRGKPAYPPVLDTATWKAVRRTLTDPRRGGVRKHRLELLESPKLVCDNCNGRMSARQREGRRSTYECRPASQGGCALRSIQVHIADEHVSKAYIAHAAEVLGKSPTEVAAWWARAAHDTRRHAIVDAVDRIEIRAARFRNRPDPDRIAITWADAPRWPPSLTGAARAAHDGG